MCESYIKSFSPEQDGAFDKNAPIATANTNNVSLAKLFLLFVGKPLASSGQFNEVQLIFHPFNRFAGKCGVTKDRKIPMSVGEFSIPIYQFKAVYNAHMKKKMTANISAHDFINMIADNFFNNDGAAPYGMGNLYTPTYNKKTGQYTYKARMSSRKMKGSRDAAMKEILGADAYKKFTPGKLNFKFECMPRIDGSNEVVGNTDILKVHIVDQNATPYTLQQHAIEAASKGNLHGVPADEGSSDRESKSEEEEKKKTESGDASKEGEVASRNLTITEIMQAIKAGIPVLKYGSETSMLKSCNLSSMMNNDLTSINLLRRGPPKSHLTPSGRGRGGLPLQTHPAELTAVSVGCPLLEYMQEFFVDFGTGTTVDNIYQVVGVDHTLKAGSFETAIKFMYIDKHGSFKTLAGSTQAVSAGIDED